MLGSVSNVSFRSNAQGYDISAPGRFQQQPAAAQPAVDEFAPSEKKKKSKAPAVIGTVGALAVAAAVALGILAGKGKLPEKTPEMLKKAGNWLAEKGTGAWKWVSEKSTAAVDWAKGLFKKAPEVAETVA